MSDNSEDSNYIEFYEEESENEVNYILYKG